VSNFLGAVQFCVNLFFLKELTQPAYNQIMKETFKPRALFFIIEFCSATSLGLISLHISKDLTLITSVTAELLFVYATSIIGIALPGYFYLRRYGKLSIYIGAIFSSVAWTFLAIFIYIISAYFVGINILQSQEAGLFFPVLFGVVGFNIFAYNINISPPPNG